MKNPSPTTLKGSGITLVPMELTHRESLLEAARDGELWKLWFTTVPSESEIDNYLEAALKGLELGHMLPWVVCDDSSGKIIGCTRYHDIVLELDRVEIGYTWYARSWQRTFVNTACKLLLLQHAFEELGCQIVGLRTDSYNFKSQAAIERLGAKKDGVIRRYGLRKDGSPRDVVMYSILFNEWPDVRRHLELRLAS